MRKRNVIVLPLVMTLALLFGTGTAVLAQSPSPGKTVLSVGDCAKCHEKEPAQIEARGAAHKTQIDCQSCHQGHRPAVADNIPQCSMCHAGSKHYELEGCRTCHNPHQPMDIVLSGDLKAPCLTCHEGPGQAMATKPSKHAEVACNFCHADSHGMIPDCVQCHQPHSSQMAQADCKACHQAHQPTLLTYGPQTGSVLCASCHQAAFDLLAASPTKHRDIACVTCHQDQHKMVPKCADCHGLPHAETMHQKFPKCADCHNIAHDLNNWPAKKEQKPESKKEAKPAAKKK